MGADSSAPWLQVPTVPVLSIEHPCIVRNADRAIHMLGGPEEIAQSLQSDTDKTLGLKFQPDDPTARAIISLRNNTDNLLLNFALPKRTGRKRKRGSNDPFADDPSVGRAKKDASYLVRSLIDNPRSYKIDVVGSIKSTHVWRTLPDFVYSAGNSSTIDQIKANILPQQYPLIRQWQFPQTYGLTNTETFPPPVFSTLSLPLNYTYRQNPAVKILADPVTGKKSLHNNQKPTKLFTHQCQHNDKVWPDRPHPKCIPLSQQPQALQDACRTMVEVFERRPLWTRRALLNQFSINVPSSMIRHATAYVCFAIRSGPWRDCLCKFGVDPRKDRSYRKFQTVLVQLVTKNKGKADTREDFARTWIRSMDQSSHIFTGESNVPPDGKSWQLCDLHEPRLKALVDISDAYLRFECETRYFGWYLNGTMAKMRVATKAIIDSLIDGEALDEGVMATFLTFPEDYHMADTESTSAPLTKLAGKKGLEWASAYRSFCRTIGGHLPTTGGSGKGRLSKPKPLVRSSFIENGQVDPMTELENGDRSELSDDEGDNDNIEPEELEVEPVEHDVEMEEP